METNQLILKPAKENEKKIWKFAEWGIKLASMVVPGTIVYMTGFAAIPIGGLMIIGSCYVSGLAGEILYIIGCDTLLGGSFKVLKYLVIGHKAANIICINKKMTIGEKIIPFVRNLLFIYCRTSSCSSF